MSYLCKNPMLSLHIYVLIRIYLENNNPKRVIPAFPEIRGYGILT